MADWTLVNFSGTTFSNGDPIPEVTNQSVWDSTTGPAWCYYNNDSANGTIYGKLYNRAAVTDARGLAPAGY
ncbi:FISUMP domain-containing protein, partial [Streptococcus uberis]